MQEQGSSKMLIEQLNAGIVNPSRKKRYYAVNQWLKCIAEVYESTNLDIRSYLRAFSYNL